MNVLSQHFRELTLRWLYIGFCLGLTFVTCYLYRLEFLYFFTRPFCVAKKHYFNKAPLLQEEGERSTCLTGKLEVAPTAHLSSNTDCTYSKATTAHFQNNSQATTLLPEEMNPLKAEFIFTDLAEGFYTTLQICLVASIFCTLPFIMYQMYCFIGPSCYLQERKHLFLFCLLEISCFIIVLCVHLFLFPEICRFLLTFQVHYSFLTLELQARIYSFVRLAARVMLVCFFSIQIPLIGIMLIKTNLITVKNFSKHSYDGSTLDTLCTASKDPQIKGRTSTKQEGGLRLDRLLGYRKIVIFISLILSAALSPPDVYIQIFVSLFFVCIFEFLVCYGYVHQRLLYRMDKPSRGNVMAASPPKRL